MNLSQGKKENQVRKIALSIAHVLSISLLFYFWLYYLRHHFLGGFDFLRRPVANSATGLYFFIKAWPVWSFPLLLLIWGWALWQGQRRAIRHERLQRFVQQSNQQQRHINELQLKLEKHAQLENEWQLSQTAYRELLQDYQRSTDFIEKLLARLAQG